MQRWKVNHLFIQMNGLKIRMGTHKGNYWDATEDQAPKILHSIIGCEVHKVSINYKNK